MLNPISFLQTGNSMVDRCIQLLTKAVNQLLAKQLLDYTILSFDLITGSNNCEHKLNRDIVGYMIVSQNSDAIIYKTESTKFLLKLTTDKNVSIKILIF